MVEGRGCWDVLFRVVNSNTVVQTAYLVFFCLPVQGGKDIAHEPVCEQEIQ